MKNKSKVNNSSFNFTSDDESVRDLSLSQSFIPTSTNEQGIGNVEGSDVTGCNLSGSDNNVSPQRNQVSENNGITGIYGSGNTINIYQYPKELLGLIEFIKHR